MIELWNTYKLEILTTIFIVTIAILLIGLILHKDTPNEI